jgi:hypothetical protein
VFPIEDGPFIVALDNTLKDMKVHREAYYGGTFNGNHAHKCLQVSITLTRASISYNTSGCQC